MPFERVFGKGQACAFVVGTVVGTGIYLKPGLVAGLVGETWQALLLWILGGLFATAGAVVYCELARTWPFSGGAYLFLHRVYGPWAASLLLAADVFLGRPAAVGALASGLGLVWGLSHGHGLLLAVALIVVLTGIQLLGSRMQGWSQSLLTGLQLVPLIVVLAMWLALGDGSAAVTATATATQGQWAAAFLAVMWAYDGWYNLTILGGEVKEPDRTFPVALIGGMAGVTVLYVALNGVLFLQLGHSGVAESPMPFLALFELWDLPVLGQALQVSLSLALLATLNGTLACGSRVLVAASQNGLVRVLLDRDPTKPTPTLVFACWCLGFLALFGGLPLELNLFDSLTELTAVIVAILTGLTVSCVFHREKLKRRVPVSVHLCALFYLGLNGVLMYWLVRESNMLALWGATSVVILGSVLWLVRKPGDHSQGRCGFEENSLDP
jgi:basic amino acid/polyamine antiporter, APA family